MLNKEIIEGHELIIFKTNRLKPYYALTKEEIDKARTFGLPIILEEIDPKCNLGTPITGAERGIIDLPIKYTGKKNKRRKEIFTKCKQFRIEKDILKNITKEELREFQINHLKKYPLSLEEIEYELDDAIEYFKGRKIFLIKLYDQNKLICLSLNIEVNKERVYTCFNDWDENYKHGVGNYCWYILIDWLGELGYKQVDLGPMDEQPYKNKFITSLEENFGVVIINPSHPLVKILKLTDI